MIRTRRRKIAILTGGGDCPGLNAVIRAATKAGIHLGYQMIGIKRGYEGLASPVQFMELTIENTANILDQGGTILGSTNKGRFAAKVGFNQQRDLPVELLEDVRQNVHQHEFDGVVCIGGDGSLSIALQLHQLGIPVVGVPKTIDNDIAHTASTFGFDSAVACAANALDRLHTTAASHERVMVLEVMGRHAGWIAVHAGIAGGGDVILIPEIPWTIDNVCAKIVQRREMGRPFTLVVVAEGAQLPHGGQMTLNTVSEQQQVRLGGIGNWVADQIQTRLNTETRCVVLGHLQRGGSPTYFDRCLSTQFGAHAIRLIEEGQFGQMVCYAPPNIDSVPIALAVQQLSTVDPNSSIVQAARALNVSFGDSPDFQNPFPNSQVQARTLVEKFNRT